MAAAAASAMPTIQATLDELTSGFSREVAAASQRVAQVAEGFRVAAQAHEQHLQAASARFAEAVGAASLKASEAAASAARSVESTLKGVSEDAKSMQGEQSKLLSELSQGYARLRDDAAGIGADMRAGVKEAGEALRASLAEAAAELQKACAENVRTVGQQLQRTTDEEFRRIAAGLDGQVKQLDEALRQELERALSALGSQLASLSDHFVRDYSQGALADRAGLPGAQARDRIGPLRGTWLARLPSSRQPLHRGLRLPGRRALPFPPSGPLHPATARGTCATRRFPAARRRLSDLSATCRTPSPRSGAVSPSPSSAACRGVPAACGTGPAHAESDTVRLEQLGSSEADGGVVARPSSDGPGGPPAAV